MRENVVYVLFCCLCYVKSHTLHLAVFGGMWAGALPSVATHATVLLSIISSPGISLRGVSPGVRGGQGVLQQDPVDIVRRSAPHSHV